MNLEKKHKRIKFNNSDSDESDSEHELSFYMKDRVKLMKQVLKLVKPKKIKSMAPDCIKNLEIAEINSLLLEELLGISNKRLGYIFNGENVDRDTSSSESDDEKQKIDVISLDDVSDDNLDNTTQTEEKTSNKKSKGIKRESDKKDKSKKRKDKKSDSEIGSSEKEKLMSVLEILELQARARAIKSQLALEESRKKTEPPPMEVKDEDSDPEAVIVSSPKPEEIIITSSDSETENNKKDQPTNPTTSEPSQTPDEIDRELLRKKELLQKKVQRIRLIRQKAAENKDNSQTVQEENKEEEKSEENVTENASAENPLENTAETNVEENSTTETTETCQKSPEIQTEPNINNEPDNDGLVINLDDDDDIESIGN